MNRLYPIQCSLLDGCIGLPVSCHLTTRLSAAHSQPYNSGESIWCFYLLVPPFSPLGTKACQKRDCKFIVVTQYQNKINVLSIFFPMLEWEGIHTLNVLKKTFAVILFIHCYIFRTLSTMTFKTWTDYFLLLWNPLLLVHHVKQWLESFAVGHFLQRWILVRDNKIDRSWID